MLEATLNPDAMARTQTAARGPSDTETPKQVADTGKPGQSMFRSWNASAHKGGVLTLISGARQYSTVPSGAEAPPVLWALGQGDAVLNLPEEDLLRHVRRTHWNIAQCASSLPVTRIDQQYIRFRSKLIAALLDEPIEDGVTHPAEGLIDEALRVDPSDCQNWLSQVLVEHYPTRPSLCASIVRCIGRLNYDRIRGWGMRVIDDALQNRDAEVREATIRALEAWGGPAALKMLRRHEDPVAWLNEYVQQVIVDLSGTTL